MQGVRPWVHSMQGVRPWVHLGIGTGLVQVLLPPHQPMLPLQGSCRLPCCCCVIMRVPQGLHGQRQIAQGSAAQDAGPQLAHRLPGVSLRLHAGHCRRHLSLEA